MANTVSYRGYKVHQHGLKWRYYDGERLVGHASLEATQKAIDEHLTRTDLADRLRRVPSIRVKDAVKLAIEGKKREKNLDDVTVRNIQKVWSKVDQEAWLHDVTAKYIREGWQKRELLASSQKQELHQFRSVITYCKKEGYLVSEDVFAIVFANTQVTNKKHIATNGDADKLLEWSRSKHWSVQFLCLCMIRWGCRPDNIKDVLKADFDPVRQCVSVSGQQLKNRDEAYYPVTQDMESLMAKAIKDNKSEFMFENSRAKKWTTEGIQSVIERARKDGVISNDISWYSFRLLADKRYQDLGMNPLAISKLMGHSIETVKKHYTRTDMNAVLDKLNQKPYFTYFDGVESKRFEDFEALSAFWAEVQKGR